MRSKIIGGGRPRLSKLPPRPSAMAFTYLCQLSDSKAHPESSHDDVCANEANNDGQCSTVQPETSSNSDLDRRCHELAPSTICETVFIAKESFGLGPQGMHGLEDCLEVDWTEKEVCIKCDKGGKLLVCSDSNCPLAVHEECMHCSARFDSMGNFYCPYCSYKRAMLETRKARKKAMLAKKALSVFLDKGMMDGDIQKQMAERVRRKKPNPSTVVGDIIEHDNTRSRLHGDDEIANHSVQMEVGCRGERFDPECTTSSSKAVEASAMNEQNDVLRGCGDIARPDDGGQYKIVTDQQMHLGPVIACGGGDGGACCREEETGLQFKIVQVGKSVQAENPKLVDDHQNERVVQDEQQARHLSASPMEKETNLNGSLHMSTEVELENGEIVKEHESGRPEEEEMRDQEQGTTVSSSGGDSMQQEHAKASDSSLGDSGDVSPHWRRIKKKNQNVLQSPNVDPPRQSARNLSFEQNTNVVHKEKKNITNKSRQRITNSPFPNPRRKKLPWTAEEEEMLKEGVQKFSTMVNKNLPWRKILEFGRHVFDGTRTPADLKDKWRNILAKE